jgi:hypothetical protein
MLSTSVGNVTVSGVIATPISLQNSCIAVA